MSMKRLCVRWVLIGMCLEALLSLFGCHKDNYILDGPGMERALWQEFTISQSSDVYEGNFAYTVTNEYDEYYLVYEYFDYKNNIPDERKIKLKDATVNELLSMDLLSLPDEQPSESLQDEEMVLDGTFAKLTVTDTSGNTYKKRVSNEMVQNIRSLLSPYVVED